MTKKEKNRVLLALVSEMRYCAESNKKNTGHYNISEDVGLVSEDKKLYLKLVNQYFGKDEEKKRAYIEYLTQILEELKNATQEEAK